MQVPPVASGVCRADGDGCSLVQPSGQQTPSIAFSDANKTSITAASSLRTEQLSSALDTMPRPSRFLVVLWLLPLRRLAAEVGFVAPESFHLRSVLVELGVWNTLSVNFTEPTPMMSPSPIDLRPSTR